MSDLLAILGQSDADDELLEEIAYFRPGRVTVLLEEHALSLDASEDARDRLAAFLYAIEQRTGAAVVGLAGDRDQLRGWRFDRVVGGRVPVAA
jgi:hypothetical protein